MPFHWIVGDFFLYQVRNVLFLCSKCLNQSFVGSKNRRVKPKFGFLEADIFLGYARKNKIRQGEMGSGRGEEWV